MKFDGLARGHTTITQELIHIFMVPFCYESVCVVIHFGGYPLNGSPSSSGRHKMVVLNKYVVIVITERPILMAERGKI